MMKDKQASSNGVRAEDLKYAQHYAKRMRENPKIALDVPEEWDFRRITELELESAIEYEFLRERFLQEDVLDYVYTIHPLFPIPWLGHRPEDNERFPLDWNTKPPSVQILSNRDETAKLVMGGMVRTGRYLGYFMTADFNCSSIKDMVRDFEKWARAEAKKHKRSLRGRASESPWAKLKWLSARRLARAGMSFADASEEVSKYQRENPISNAPDVLPIFSRDSGWYRALKKAEEKLRSM